MFDTIKYVLIKFCSFCNLDCSYCIISDRDSKAKSNVFNQSKELRKLLLTMDIGPVLDFELTGGECSLYCNEIRSFMKEMKKIERYKDTRVIASTVTNGTNLDGIFELLDDNVLDSWSMKMSWDGLYSASKVRFSKLPQYDDQFFRDQVAKLGASKYRNDILLRIALTHETVDDLYDSVKYARDCGCNKIEYYPLYLKEDPMYYHDEELLKKFKVQAIKIAELYNNEPFDYENWNYLYYTRALNAGKPFDLGCEILGKMIYVTTPGDVYPCSLFSENFKQNFIIGTVKDGIEYDKMEKFVKDYTEWDNGCSECSQYHCNKCPAMLYYTRHKGLGCYIHPFKKLESDIFETLAPALTEQQTKKILGRLNFVNDPEVTDRMPSWIARDR